MPRGRPRIKRPEQCPWCNEDHEGNRALWNRHSRYDRTSRNGGIAPVSVHNVSTYVNWGCRCDPCTADNSQVVRDRKREYRARLVANA